MLKLSLFNLHFLRLRSLIFSCFKKVITIIARRMKHIYNAIPFLINSSFPSVHFFSQPFIQIATSGKKQYISASDRTHHLLLRKIETGKSFTFDSFHAVNGIHTAISTITPITFSFVIFTLPSPCHITYIDFTIITNPSCYMIIAFGNKKSLPTSDKPFLSIQNISSKVAV